MVSLFQSLGSTIQVSNSGNASNELVREGQIAQQLLAGHFKEACYVFPGGTTLSLAASGYSTSNAFGSPNTDWIINTHPMVAMILPPDLKDSETTTSFRFVAYYVMPRSQYTTNSSASVNPGKDSANDSTTWVLLEYRRGLPFTEASAAASGTACNSMATSANIKLGKTNLLLDYVQIANPITSLFTVGGAGVGGGAAWIQYDLRLQKDTRTGNIIRVGGAGANSNLSGKVYPINLGL